VSIENEARPAHITAVLHVWQGRRPPNIATVRTHPTGDVPRIALVGSGQHGGGQFLQRQAKELLASCDAVLIDDSEQPLLGAIGVVDRPLEGQHEEPDLGSPVALLGVQVLHPFLRGQRCIANLENV
jgi:hypothetical protein